MVILLVFYDVSLTNNHLNSLTAIDGHDRQYFNELRARVVSLRIFAHC
jgi:hypothetical protein